MTSRISVNIGMWDNVPGITSCYLGKLEEVRFLCKTRLGNLEVNVTLSEQTPRFEFDMVSIRKLAFAYTYFPN